MNKEKYYFERPNYEFGLFFGLFGYGLGYIFSNFIISIYLNNLLQIHQINAINNTSIFGGILFFIIFFLVGSLIEYKKIELKNLKMGGKHYECD